MSRRLWTSRSEYATLGELLAARAVEQPDKVAYTFLLDEQHAPAELRYADLDRRARAIAAELQQHDAAGARALLLYPPGLDYIAALFGCWHAGVTAVPAYPPQQNRSTSKLPTIVADAQATFALTNAATSALVERHFADEPTLAALTWLTTDTIDSSRAAAWQTPTGSDGTLALLQYTSGSTAAPKGVMLSHSNVLHNLALIQRCFEVTSAMRGVIWLPPYHDMGLIGGILQPLFGGASVTLMTPVAFLQRPIRWLQAISDTRATMSGGPNFAYDLCVRKITPEQRAQLDLSSWELAFNGAEPIRADVIERFTEAFAPSGFRRSAWYPCYGLAEATLLVSGGSASAAPTVRRFDPLALEQNEAITSKQEHSRALVGCGASVPGQDVVIVDPDRRVACADGRIGEIWVTGASVAQGYWQQPELTEQAFQARLADDPDRMFLRTGDLGFVLDGELFITGRRKDLLIIRGRNYYPQDIERTVERSHHALRPGASAAFTVEHAGETRLVVVQEIERQHRKADADAIVAAAREAVADEHGLHLHQLVLLKPGTIPKTSSGKIQRHACQQRYVAGSLDLLAQPTPATPAPDRDSPTLTRAALLAADPSTRPVLLLSYLQHTIGRAVEIAPQQIDPQRSLTILGLDSLMLVELQHRIETEFSVVVPAADLLQGLSLGQLVAQMLAAIESRPTLPAPIQPTQNQISRSPLSHGQRALWFLHQIAPLSSAYHIASAVRIRAPLDRAALTAAFQALAERHSALRTTFAAVDGEPLQHIHAQLQPEVVYLDAADWDANQLSSATTAAAQQPFNLERGPLLRVHVFAQSPQDHTLLLNLHHIVGDFWSLAVLLQELGVVYRAARTNVEATLPPLTIQYSDFVRRQADLLASAEGERLWQFWQRQLHGTRSASGVLRLPVLDLPTDRPRPANQTYAGAAESFTLSPALTQQLKGLAVEQQMTLYTVLLAAFQVLLHRYSNQTDILVGTPMAGRTTTALANLVGYVVNPVVMRADLSGNPAFASLLVQVRETALGAFTHQDYPFDALVERLQVERDPARSPLFQVMFVLQQAPLLDQNKLTRFALGQAGARMMLGELPIESVAWQQQAAQFDLTLVMAEGDGALHGSVQYNSDLFDAATMQRLAGHFATLLQGIATQPTQPIAALPLLSATERRTLLHEWNSATLPLDLPPAYVQVAAQAERTPEALAIDGAGAQLSYRVLDQRANRLAHYLRTLGVGPEVCVGVCMERTPDLVVALLAIWKAGGAYVPLDPAYPAARLQFMLQDTDAALLLSQRSLAAVAPAWSCTIYLDDALSDLDRYAATPPALAAAADRLAYVLYTSGSTGQPKGVAIAHGSVTALLAWAHTVFGTEDLAGVLAATSINFDLSVFELFAPLTAGGAVLLAEQALQLPELSAAERVTLINTVPSAMTELLRLGDLPPGVRTVNLAGEALPPRLVRDLYQQPGVARVLNLYGPSEDTTYSTWAVIERGETQPPIGRPLPNTQAYLLDAQMQPVPTGVPGELYLGGAGLGRGYLNRPALTAARFVPDPFSSTAGARLYRTGDLARYRHDGQLIFLGRLDHQVKLRGFRIELGEIEAALLAQPGVRDAVVLARTDQADDMRLVGYVVPHDQQPSADALRDAVRATLPEYMVPAHIVMLSELPRTPNGKLDRSALPAPDLTRPATAAFVAPRTTTEQTIAEIWRDVLGLREVSVEDNFFALGGHSLLATQIITRVRESLHVDLPLHTLFTNPTIATIATAVEQAQPADQPLESLTLTANTPSEAQPLSFAQQRLWLLDQIEPGNAAYNVAAALRLSGPLDIVALRRSLSTIVARHAVLRTTFAVIDEQPVQIVAPTLDLPFAVIDLRDLSERERDHQAQQRIRAEAAQPFDLERGPLLRMTLLHLRDDEHILLITLHHIVTDGWSNAILINELVQLYTAFTEGRPAPLSPLPIQYADFARRQREAFAGARLDAQLGYWQQQLAGVPVLELPTDRPRPAVQTFRGAQFPFQIPAALHADLLALGQREDATLFMTALATLQVLLYRYTSQPDFAIGTPIANRTQTDTETLIGYFVNTLVLRANLDGNPSFRALLGRVRATCLEAYAHQDMPFEKLVEAVQPERTQSHSPLFQVVIALENTPAAAITLNDMTVQPLPTDSATAKFDLTLFLRAEDDALHGTLEYNTDLFDATTIGRLAGHFQTLLAAVVAQPDRSIDALPLLTAAEQEYLLRACNESDAAYPRDTTAAALFEAQAARTPDTVAVVYDGQQLSYDHLNTRANQLAHHLQTLGVGPDVPVALCVERSVAMLVAIVAVLKAGGCYVPLDPAYPAARLQFMLQTSRAPVLLTEAALRAALPATSATIVCLDSDWPAIAEQPTHNPVSVTHSEHIAYIIFTSGSTGQPKGVMVPQRGLVNLAYGLRAFFDDPAVRQTGLITSISFDISVNQIFPTLFFGRTLHVIPDAVKFDSPALLRYLDAHAIHLLDAVPSYLQATLAAVAPAQPPNVLRYLLVGGEKLEARLLDAVFEQLGDTVAIVNIYGLTELSDINAFGVIRAEHRAQPITVGRPLQNNRIYIVNAALEPQPVGVTGEVCVAGESVSRGYLAQPALSAERFVVCPFEDGARMGRTGDLGRWRPDGTIEILGRIDQQVKLRGFRIETGEIEAVLLRHAAVRECVVVVREDQPGAQRLVAYVVGEPGGAEPRTKNQEPGDGEPRTKNQEPGDRGREPRTGALWANQGPGDERTTEQRNKQGDTVGSQFSVLGSKDGSSSELRQHAARYLPEYMVPAAFVELAALPTTPNGKIDRKALPAPTLAATEQVEQEPRTPVETLVAEIWRDVLGLEAIGIHDDFFALGGHSLLATQIVTRVRDTFAINLPLRALFESTTIAALSATIEQVQRSEQAFPFEDQQHPYVPLSFAQQRLWLLDQIEPGNAAYNLPAALRLSGPLDSAALRRSLHTIVGRHAALRTTFAVIDEQPSQVIRATLPLPLPLTDLRDLSEAERAAEIQRIMRAEAQQPFDLQRGPLIRTKLLRLGTTEHILLITLHHIVADGWSIGVLLRELAALYPAAVQGTTAALPELPTQLADFARWQHEWFQGEQLETHLRYWRSKLVENPPVLHLPTDWPRPATQTFRGGKHTTLLPTALTEALKNLSQQEGVTLFMTLLAAFKIVLARHSGQDDIVVGAPIANRSRHEAESLIGFFVNTLPLRSDLSGNPRFHELLKATQQLTAEAYAHQELPFEKILDEFQPTRSLSHTPIFQVLFNMLPPTALPTIPGLSLELLEPAEIGAKFDLTLYIEEKPAGLQVDAVYNADLFAPATIGWMIEHFQALLNSVARNPAQRIADIPLPPPIMPPPITPLQPAAAFRPFERAALTQTIVARFEQQVQRGPQRLAVQSREHCWTYAELNRAANRVAHALRSVAPDAAQVALLFEHDAPMIAGVLGVLKAGSAYVPLDPAFPVERLAYILADAQVGAIVTSTGQRALAETLIRDTAIALITFEELADADDADPPRADRSASAAYILYTSGSTGQPKGVVQSQGNVLHHIRAYTNNLYLSSDDRLALLASYCFDAAVMDLFGALLNGAALLAFDIKRQDMADLPAWLAEHEATIYHSTPTIYRALVQTLGEQRLPRLRLVVLGGEEARGQDTELFKQFFAPECVLVNGLGPTESTVTLQHFVTEQSASRGSLPVGYPVTDTSVLLLDRAGRPADVLGEIAIRSPYVALGYWNQPELTRQAFSADADGERVYLTGDLGRRLADGSLVFMGRKDDQVKIRGVRIELGEIEAVLREHAAIEDVAVAAYADTSDSARLVAYIVARQPNAAAPDKLRQFLQQRVPDYMLPSAFMFLEQLPLTATGKVDRRALPAPTDIGREHVTEYVAPRGATETLLAQIWAGVLGREPIGIHDDFFALGGHSLNATQMLTRVRDTFQVELSLRTLFDAPTLATFAALIVAAQPTAQRNAAAAVLLATDTPQPLSFGQERLWLLDQLEPGNTAYNLPANIRLRGRLDVTALQHSISRIIERHTALRTTFETRDGQPIQVIAPPSVPELPLIDLREHAEHDRDAEVQRLLDAEASTAFDLERGPLLRVQLLRLQDDEHILLATMHHIVSDGWSLSVFVNELTALYEAALRNTPDPLPPLPMQYSDFARWQREWMTGGVLATQLDYWTQQLRGAPPLLELPTDRPRPAVRSFQGATALLHIEPELSAALRELSQGAGATLYMTLLAAFKLVLARHSGLDDIVVGTPIAGRTQRETEGLIGFFLNTLVLRTDLSAAETFAELLAQVRETALGAYAHQDLPFEKLLDELQPERDLSHSPLFQVFFNMLNLPAAEIALPGLTATPLTPSDIGAKFDLTLYVREADHSIQCELVYNATLFDAGRIEELLAQWHALLAQIVARPNAALHDYSLLTPAASALLPDPAVPLDATWHGAVQTLFTQQARRRPDHPALVEPQGSWSYRELDQHSSRLAQYLVAQGMEPQEIVAIYSHRSAALVWAVLGVLKAGAAFMILDPSYPAARLIDYLEVAQPSGWIALEEAGALPDALGTFIAEAALRCRLMLPPIAAAATQQTIAAYPPTDPEVEVSAEHVACIGFTSGSTGRPKGILGRHGPLTHFLPWQQQRFGLGQDDRYSMLSGLAHDPLQRDMFTPLCTGATICIPQPTAIGTPDELIGWMEREAITVANLTPALAQILTETTGDSGPPLVLSALRYTFIVGDVLTLHDVARIRALAPDVTCVNLYGSTETQRSIAYYVIPDDAVETTSAALRVKEILPLGQAVQDAQLLVLNRARQLAGIGEVGELYMRSPHLARGYIADDALTTAKFLPNWFSEQSHPDDRLYRTGDLGRYRPDGIVEFVGRADQQVQIRGFRVELGEIEAVLAQHVAVREAAVIAVGDGAARQLVAYVVEEPRAENQEPRIKNQAPRTENQELVDGNNGATEQTNKRTNEQRGQAPEDTADGSQFLVLGSSELRAWLQGKLPSYMIPAVFMTLAALPVTPNGKLDRQALPEPSGNQQAVAFVAPRTQTEHEIAALWGALLHVKQVGIHDDFFHAGGHSLLATQLMSRIRTTFGVELPLQTLFMSPTVLSLAEVVETALLTQSSATRLDELLARLADMDDDEAQELAVGQDNG